MNRAIEAPEFYLIIISRIGKASLRGDNPHRLPTQMGVDRVRRGKSIDLHQSRLHHDLQARFQVTIRQKAKPRPAPLPKTSASAASKARAATAQTKAAKVMHHAKQAAQAAGTTAKKVADVVMAGLKALWVATQTLMAAIAAGGTTALLVIVVLCMVAMVAGSAFGIFFAAEPTGGRCKRCAGHYGIERGIPGTFAGDRGRRRI